MNKTFIERRVYEGAEVRRGYRVKGIKCVQDRGSTLPVELAKVPSLMDYSSGCSVHRGQCFGHMCETPTGNLLPPHSLSFRSGDIRTQYYIAASRAFEEDHSEYIDALKRTNYGKEGHLRSVMSTPVSGSARLVCVPHDYSDPRVAFISENLASKILFCAPGTLGDGTAGARYVERPLREGDYVMVERAPSLSKFNNQPMRLMYWDIECIGIHPKAFSYFHGDYDGDEVHLYALGAPRSVNEASAWRVPLDRKLCAAERYMLKRFPEVYDKVEGEGDLRFLEYTTLSFREIKQGLLELPMGDLVRNKREHLSMFRERMEKKPGTKTFLQDSIKGVKDIMRQQISQGRIGDMSRVARISAMCFTRGREGGTFAIIRRTRLLLNDLTKASPGCPAVRCVMVLCQASQEAALHAHRVGSTEATGIDLVCNLLRGRAEGGEFSPQDTLFVVSSTDADSARVSLGASWCYKSEGHIVAVAKDSAGSEETMERVVGAYSPVVLSRLPKQRRKEACRKGLRVVYNYYNLELEGDDIEDMVEAMCYRVELSNMPVTTREGMISRGLGWMETLMACDYTKLPLLAGSESLASSATSATMCANFSYL